MFIKSSDLKLENKGSIKITRNSKIIISSNFLSLEEVSHFYLKVLPNLLLGSENTFSVYPYFKKIKQYSPKAQATLILLYENNFKKES